MLQGFEDMTRIGFSRYMADTKGGIMKKSSMKFVNEQKNGQVRLVDDQGNPVWIMKHYVIARMFVPNPRNLEYVNFLDGVKHHCNADNLFWSSYRNRGESIAAEVQQMADEEYTLEEVLEAMMTSEDPPSEIYVKRTYQSYVQRKARAEMRAKGWLS